MFNAEEDDLKFIPEVIPFQLLFAAGHSLQRLKEHFALLIFISLDWAVSSILSCVWRASKTYAPNEGWVAAAQMNGLDSLSPACGLVLPLFSWLFILFKQTDVFKSALIFYRLLCAAERPRGHSVWLTWRARRDVWNREQRGSFSKNVYAHDCADKGIMCRSRNASQYEDRRFPVESLPPNAAACCRLQTRTRANIPNGGIQRVGLLKCVK